jgi:hypothetical protein
MSPPETMPDRGPLLIETSLEGPALEIVAATAFFSTTGDIPKDVRGRCLDRIERALDLGQIGHLLQSGTGIWERTALEIGNGWIVRLAIQTDTPVWRRPSQDTVARICTIIQLAFGDLR